MLPKKKKKTTMCFSAKLKYTKYLRSKKNKINIGLVLLFKILK